MKIVAFITLAIIAYFVSTDIYTPSMPTIAAEFHAHRDTVQQTLTFFLAGAILSCLFSGMIADRYGKRKILLAGLLIAVIGSVIAAFCATINQLLFARFLQGAGGAIGSIVGFAIVHDYTSEHKTTKVFGVLGIYFAVIPALAPALGGFLNDHLGWRSNFYVLLGLFICAFIGILKGVPKDPARAQGGKGLFRVQDYCRMLKTRPFMFVILLSPLFVSGEWFMISFLPFYFQQKLHYTPELYGFFLGSLIPWYAGGSYLAGKYGQKVGLNKLIYVGLVLGILAAFILLVTALSNPGSIILIYIGLCFFFIGFGILFPTTATKTFGFFPSFKATAGSLRSLCGTLFAFLGAEFADVPDESRLIHFALYFCLFSILAFLLFKFRGEIEEGKPQP